MNTASASKFVEQSDFEDHVRDAIQQASNPVEMDAGKYR